MVMLKHDPVLDCTLGEVRLTCACQTLRGVRTWANNINDATAKINALKKIDTAIANAEANAAVAASTTKALGAFGASTYIIGGTFGIIDIGDGADPGQIDGGDLEPVLESLFTQSREFLEKMGRMAAGHAEEGDDYNLLPG
ncbi:hypothetical protein LTR09_010255 [Extremus antarcticus]|uniref:Uncharacterized protein n=1 Tax=Extremus antarcticus TaxID=702011 RepID=A0AAJ0D7Y6_9PEZI|nr:hypothetical protein LTR09_010255 [Extremus antarcticus]